MISIITCSINPESSECLRRNIAATIDVPFEYIPLDNRIAKLGLCEAYNLCAERAAGDILCFAHEDIHFLTNGWGRVIADKLSETDCGAIGFAGSTIKPEAYSGWNTGIERCKRVFMTDPDGRKISINPDGRNFSQVVTLDGFCLFVRKEVWGQTKFDQETFKGFHCYDIDFSSAVAGGRRNYVCNCIDVLHFSTGRCDGSWYADIVKLHDKWADRLPLYVKAPNARQRRKDECEAWTSFIMWMINDRICPVSQIRRLILCALRRHPLCSGIWKTAVWHTITRIRAFGRCNR